MNVYNKNLFQSMMGPARLRLVVFLHILGCFTLIIGGQQLKQQQQAVPNFDQDAWRRLWQDLEKNRSSSIEPQDKITVKKSGINNHPRFYCFNKFTINLTYHV